MKITLLKKRLLAFAIDHLIILAYASILLGIGLLIGQGQLKLTPYTGQMIGFFTLTLPVFLYFSLTENSKSKASLGKKYLKIRVKKGNAFYRNFLKLLPWEVAHTGVHWVIHYSSDGLDVPLWNMTLLILPQLMIIFYLISMIHSEGRQTLYDKWSGAEIALNNKDF